ncbi:DNA-binding transcriptional LysR family regulator [Silvimonas terrae]|uniref:DNA-binding transcriptional LysR family regulator n=1 Tax=Silvimonas terrae TaxID=300266 RepID=A0A840RA58_9NEIS|nr:LysR family transcriptional regulator [Silvimonas terrae]MBB5189418.1 DNA-binding transcriptional LysR family regulator [Silvimonas terrae]
MHNAWHVLCLIQLRQYLVRKKWFFLQFHFSIYAMVSLEHIRILVAAIDTGGLASAARLLGLSPASVTRAIAALEAELGVKLLHRGPRGTRLTETGETFLLDTRHILEDLEHAEATARNAHLEPVGLLTVTAPVLFGRLHVAPLLTDFLESHPKVRVQAIFADRLVHIVEEGVDVALRIAPLPDSALTAVQVGAVRLITVAAPAYLSQHGIPSSIDDLPSHRAIGYLDIGGGPKVWRLTNRDGDTAGHAQPDVALSVNTADVAIDAAISGYGLARVLSYQVYDHIEQGRLQRVLQSYEPPPTPVNIVYPQGRRAAAKIRYFVDFAAKRLRVHPALGER